MERLICTNNGLKSFVVVIKTLWVNHHSSVVIFAWLVMEILMVGISMRSCHMKYHSIVLSLVYIAKF